MFLSRNKKNNIYKSGVEGGQKCICMFRDGCYVSSHTVDSWLFNQTLLHNSKLYVSSENVCSNKGDSNEYASIQFHDEIKRFS